MITASAVVRVLVPAQVRAPRGAIAAAALMVRVLRGIASVSNRRGAQR